MRKLLIIATLLAAGTVAEAQNYGEIHGRVFDYQSAEPLLFVTVSTDLGGQLIGTTTDDEGRFKLKPLQPGTYTLEFRTTGYDPKSVQQVVVNPGKISFIDDVVMTTNNELPVVEISGITLIDFDEPNVTVIRAIDLKHNAMIKNPTKLIGTITPELKTDENGQFLVRGSRPGTSATYIDGMRLVGPMSGMAGAAIRSISVYTGGIPARFGDITGGVVVIETKSYFDYFYERNPDLN